MTRAKWPTYQAPQDGNIFQWILSAAAAARAGQKERLDSELARIEEQQTKHGDPQDSEQQ